MIAGSADVTGARQSLHLHSVTDSKRLIETDWASGLLVSVDAVMWWPLISWL
jgi:hypothetical protein